MSWYPSERQWVVIFFAYVGAFVFILIGLRVLPPLARIALILLLGLALNLWRHSRKYPPH